MLELLVFVRHGDAEFYGPEGTDVSRRLTKKGVKALRRGFPEVFKNLEGRDDIHIWVSPAVRAIQTAEVVGETLGIDPDEFDIHNSLYDQDDDEFLAELEAEGDGCVIAVGHVPFVQRVTLNLTDVDVPFSKGSVAAISFGGETLREAELEWFALGKDY